MLKFQHSKTMAIGMGRLLMLLPFLAGTVFAGPVIYEGFSDSETTLSGNTPGTGLSGTWTASNTTISNENLSHGVLRVAGNKAAKSTNTSINASVSTGTSLSDAGLLAHGVSLWFSALLHTGVAGPNPQFAFGLTTDSVQGGNNNNLPLVNTGDGIGIFIKENTLLYANTWTNGVGYKDSSYQAIGGQTTNLVVGEIIWGVNGASYDVVNVYLPDVELVKGAVVSTMSNILDQSTFDMVSFGAKKGGGILYVDEIRFGASYDSVVPDSTQSGLMFIMH